MHAVFALTPFYVDLSRLTGEMMSVQCFYQVGKVDEEFRGKILGRHISNFFFWKQEGFMCRWFQTMTIQRYIFNMRD